MLFADVSATALGSAIKSSPLVDRSTLPGVRLGWLYRF
ncbi:MipA/OmpV family protein [Aquabacterium sp.]